MVASFLAPGPTPVNWTIRWLAVVVITLTTPIWKPAVIG